MNGFVVSKADVDDFDFVDAPGLVGLLDGEGAKDALLMAETSEGVRGVFTSERDR